MSPLNSYPYAPPTALPARGKPIRLLAFFLSLVAVGVGQLYLGRFRRGIVWLVIVVLGTPVACAIFPSACRDGLFSVAAILILLTSASRFFSALDTLFITPREERPSGLVVAVGVLVVFVLLVASAIVTRRFLLEAYKIPSSSMLPTFQSGDHVFIDKSSDAMHRGQVIVFAYPEHRDQDFVKRVIAVAGDRLEMRNGHPLINGWEVPHCKVGHGTLPRTSDDHGRVDGEVFMEYLEGEAYLTFSDESAPAPPSEGPWLVKKGETFVLGDNRENSHDSRRWYGGVGGGVPRGDVRGEVVVIWLSVTEAGVAWSRTGQGARRPALPPSMQALANGLEACLASRPPDEATVPPAAP